VDRAASLFYYLQHADWEPTYAPELKYTTLAEYQSSGTVERNWMVRFLIGKESEALTVEDLEYAKGILAQKMLVGLTDRMEKSLRRFGSYFGWDHREDWTDCLAKFSTSTGRNSFQHPKVQPGSLEWEAIVQNNEYDMALYQYAVEQFENQAALF
jgi:hypothetical protein